MSRSTKSILLIEDNPGDARLVQVYLDDAPHDDFVVQHVSTLAEADFALQKQEFDAIVLDLSLPDGQGTDAVRRVLALGATGKPLVVLTGNDDDTMALEALEAGAQDYLVKGDVTTKELVRSLRYSVERKQAAAAKEAAEDALRETLSTLERRVEERTAELARANTDLLREIDARESMANTLRKSEAQIRAIVEGSIVGIVTITTEGIVNSVNSAAEALFGYHANEIVGKNVTALMPLPHADKHDGYLRRYIDTGVKRVIGLRSELIGRRKDGSVFPMELAVSEIGEGEDRFFIGFLTDISDRKDAEAALKRARKEAETANHAKSQFLATMSHELRTPMNGVLGTLDLFERTELDPKQRRLVTLARASADSLLVLINDILDISKIEAGKITLETVDVALRDITEGVVLSLAQRAEGRSVELMNIVHEDVPPIVRGDAVRIRQILTNLVGNAIKFTENGDVTVRTLVESESADRVVIKFSVTDTGIGIPPDTLEKLFTPFTQADTSTTRCYGGTGLGLAISKQLTELMGGQIGVTSEPGQGSTFWFTADLEKQSGHITPIAVPAESRDLRILAVDDNSTNREILHAQLVNLDLEHEVVADAQQAMQRLREQAAIGRPFTLAILDMQMPGMDGEQLAHCIKHDPIIADTLLVLLTSISEADNVARWAAAGFSGCVVKPVIQTRLLEALVEATTNGGVEPTTSTRMSVKSTATGVGRLASGAESPSTPLPDMTKEHQSSSDHAVLKSVHAETPPNVASINNTVSRSYLPTHRNRIMKVLYGGVALTLLVFLGLGFCVRTAHQAIADLPDTELKLARLHGSIRWMDELMTMSMHLATTTGESQWEERYFTYLPILDDAISKATALASEIGAANTLARIEEASVKLQALENLAIDLIRAGKPDAALHLVRSDEYKLEQEQFRNSLAELDEITDRSMTNKEDDFHHRISMLEILGVSAVFVLATGWFVVLFVTWRNLRAERAAGVAARKAEAAARAAEQTKSNLLASMSHELRTPLNGMIGMTNLALSNTLDAQTRAQLESARSSAHALLRLVENVVDYAQIESCGMNLDCKPFSVRLVVENVLKTVQDSVEKKGLTSQFSVDRGIPALLGGDSARLQQVLLNLVGNAVKFTDTGEIALHADVEKETPTRTSIRFTVKDTGIGILPEKVDQLFVPFEQIDMSMARTHCGAGLGLAISRKIVESMDGAISVTSAMGRGTTFAFTAQFTNIEHEENATSAGDVLDAGARAMETTDDDTATGRKQNASDAKVNILLVDDNEIGREVASMTLLELGYECDLAANGREAVDAVLNKPYDIVFMDCQMPEMDGFAATELIRQCEHDGVLSGEGNDELRIVALTANVVKGDRERCLQAGMDDYLTKPLDAAQLDAMIKKLGSSGSFRSHLSTDEGIAEPVSENDLEVDDVDGDSIVVDMPFNRKAMFKRWGKNNEFADALIAKFCMQAQEDVGRLNKSVSTCNVEDIREYAHGLKGAASYVGAEAFRAVAERLEMQGISGDLTDVASSMKQLQSELERCLEYIANNEERPERANESAGL